MAEAAHLDASQHRQELRGFEAEPAGHVIGEMIDASVTVAVERDAEGMTMRLARNVRPVQAIGQDFGPADCKADAHLGGSPGLGHGKGMSNWWAGWTDQPPEQKIAGMRITHQRT